MLMVLPLGFVMLSVRLGVEVTPRVACGSLLCASITNVALSDLLGCGATLPIMMIERWTKLSAPRPSVFAAHALEYFAGQ